MAFLTLTRKPAGKYSMHAGDYELWINNQPYAKIPNESNPLSYSLEPGTYQIQVRKPSLMRSHIVEISLSENSQIKLATGSGGDRGASFLTGMLGCLLGQALYGMSWFKSLTQNIWFMIIFIVSLITSHILQLRFGKMIFLTVE